MPFPTSKARIERAERELGRSLPRELVDRLLRDNGGEITATPVGDAERRDFDPCWELHPVWDDSTRKTAGRTASHIVHETNEASGWPGFPSGAIAIASNGTADLLIVLPDSDEVVYWSHEDGESLAVEVHWE